MANLIKLRRGKKPLFVPFEGTEKYQIYTLADPTNGDIKYVGYTTMGLARRLTLHKSINDFNRKRYFSKISWIESLTNKGVLPVIETIDETDNLQDALRLECFWIDLLRSWGFVLLNIYYGRSPGYRSRQKTSHRQGGNM